MKTNHQLSSNYDVVIIGSGPSGLAAAYFLLNSFPALKILMIDAGYLRKKDKCFMEKDLKRFFENPEADADEPRFFQGCRYASKCGVCQTIAGFGGCLSPNVSAKLCFPPSGKRLPRLIGEQKVDQIATQVWAFYSRFAGLNLPYPVCDSNEGKQNIARIVAAQGLSLFEHPSHVAGELEMNRFSRGVYDWLDQRIDMALGCLVDPVKDIDTHRHQICLNDGSKVAYDKLLLATGRFGHTTIKDFFDCHRIAYETENLGFGQRMVLSNRYLWPIGRHYPDFKLKGEDEFFKYETFCFNGCRRGGRLKCMNYGGFINVDGLVSVDFDGDRFHDVVYGNFAVLTECKVAGVDYNNGRPQDGISLQRMPILGTAAFMRKIYRILAEVNRVPENEIGRQAFFTPMEYENIWARIKTDNGFRVLPDVAVIGDASGIAMGIIASMITGFYTAEQLIEGRV